MLLGVFAVTSVMQLCSNKLVWESKEPADILQGKSALILEESYNKSLVFKEAATDFWGAIRYGAFKTGSKGAVIGTDNWLYTAEEFDMPAGFDENIKTNLAFIASVQAKLAAKGIALKLLLLPSKARIYPEYLGSYRWPVLRQKVYAEALATLPADWVMNSTDALLAAKKTAPLFMQTDTHWSPEGAKTVADFVAMQVKGVPLIPNQFVTRHVGTKNYRGDLARFVPTGWARPYLGPKAEPLTIWKTEAVSEGDLFAEPEISVALVGTSYSAIEKWNFAGFLQQALQADVLNVADEGGGPIKPMRKFLEETDFSNSKIKLVIWEFPERFLPVTYEEKKQ